MPNIGSLGILLLMATIIVLAIVAEVRRQRETAPPRAGTPLGMPANNQDLCLEPA